MSSPIAPRTLATNLALCLLLVAVSRQVADCKSLEKHEVQWPLSGSQWVPLKDFKPLARVESMKSDESRQASALVRQPAAATKDSTHNAKESARGLESEQVGSVPTVHEASASVMSEMKAPTYYQLSESRRRHSAAANRRPAERSDHSESEGPSHREDSEHRDRRPARQDSYLARQRDEDSQGQQDEENSSDGDRRYGRQDSQAAREALEGGESNEALDEADAPNQESGEDQEPPARGDSRDREQDDSQAEQSAQEAAEASEAEAADRAALDEQQQTQREIIRAQAESEAKAIKEQQEALMRQQRLHQQIVMRRAYDLSRNASEARDRNSLVEPEDLQEARAHNKRRKQKQQRQQQQALKNLRWSQSQPDIQFSDQLDGGADSQDERAEQSMRRPRVDKSASADAAPLASEQKVQTDDQLALGEPDLQRAAAQHSYGAHYGALHSHQNHYYQFAESHKKGQFDSGFKRGGKKFHISGHAAQKKHHAEGHVKWQGKKGKGSHYWSLKHKGKKHGHGHGY